MSDLHIKNADSHRRNLRTSSQDVPAGAATLSRSSRWSRDIRFFGILRESPPLHFYCLQAIGFFYLLWRFASRNYTVYGYLPAELFDYPRTFNLELWPIPLLHFTSFQFIYALVPRPTPEVLFAMQLTVVALCVGGLLGLKPKACAIGAFLIALHVTGMVQASNAELDGGTLALCAMFVLAVSPRESFYRFGAGFALSKRSVACHWPVFLFLMIVGAFYTSAGINKLVDVGPMWPFSLHLERLAAASIEQTLFVTGRFSDPWVCSLHHSYALSVFGGIVTLTAELGFLGILFVPRFRLALIVTMIAFHALVYFMSGINFLGSGILLVACLDWNVLARTAKVDYSGHSKAVTAMLGMAKRMDWFGRLTMRIAPCPASGQDLVPDARGRAALILVEENGERYEGLDAIEQVSARCPPLWPLALALKIPGVMQVARGVARHATKTRPAVKPAALKLQQSHKQNEGRSEKAA